MSAHPVARCRSLLITLLGRHVAGRGTAVYSGTFIDALGQAGFGTHAVRSALARMVPRGLLVRHRRGRRSYYAPSPSMERLLLAGRRRIYESDVVLTDWDGEWTLLSFSVPEHRRADRHRLRARLAWAGFGSLRHGLWVAPGRQDADLVVEDLALDDAITCFHGTLHPRTAPGTVVARAWDLDAMADAYRAFLDRWPNRDAAADLSPLARHLWLITDWRLLLRETQVLPADVVPPDWPAEEARARFRDLDAAWGTDAAHGFEELCDSIDITVEPRA